MIASRLHGRLGNQMFQYAFAYLTSKKRGEDFFVLSSSSEYSLDYFELNGKKNDPTRNSWSRFLFYLKHPFPKTLIQYGSENMEAILKESESCHLLNGYFQSEGYFENQESVLRELFTIKKEHKEAFEKKYKTLFETGKTLVIHIRRTDYVNWDIGEKFGGENLSLPFSYFESFLSKFNKPEYKVIFISDDLSAVKAHFGEQENFFYENNSEIMDLQLLMHADVLCLSNSSFSWWGAYLNAKTNKQVFAPQYWLGFKTAYEYPHGILCKNWQHLPVKL